MLQTFSKIYGLAGIRVGFGVASEPIIQSILRVKEPFNVNSLAQTAAAAAITDEEHVTKSIQINSEGRELFYKFFNAIGLKYTESMSNFILVEFGAEAKEIYEELLNHGVIVRYGDTWGLPEHIRISIGTPEENSELIVAICTILAKK